jgi:membrane protein YdbS with pleckstrin-like domain
MQATGDAAAVRRPSHRLDPRVRSIWWLVGGLVTLAVAVVVFVVARFFDVPAWVSITSIVLIALAAAVVPPLRYRRWSYALRERDVLISKGAVFFVQQVIPFDRIQFVESRQGPLDRLFELTQVVLYTAAGRAGHVPGLSSSQAEALREELSRVAGTSSA